MKWTRWIFGFVIVAMGVAQADPNLIINAGFESGNFFGWSETGNITPCLFVGTSGDARCIPTTGLGPHSGTYTAELGNYGADAFLSQTIATTVGSTYELSFWLASQDYGTPSNDFSVTWGGQQVFSGVNLAAFGYTQYVFPGLTASQTSTVLSFGFHNNPSYFALDDVLLTDPAVPESGTAAEFAGLLVLFALIPARRRPSANPDQSATC